MKVSVVVVVSVFMPVRFSEYRHDVVKSALASRGGTS
jgi:hypothetical protein